MNSSRIQAIKGQTCFNLTWRSDEEGLCDLLLILYEYILSSVIKDYNHPSIRSSRVRWPMAHA